MRSATPAQRLAQWCSALSFGELPDDVVHLAKACLLDFCALAVGGVRTEAGEAALTAFAHSWTDNGCRILGTCHRAAPSIAALMNGLFAHTLQSDDGIRRAHGHPGAPIVAAALAAGEWGGRTGSELLLGIVAGYEVFARVGESVNPSHLRRGFHPSGTVGGLAAAVAAAKVLGLEEGPTADALGLAGSVSGGLMEYAETGTMATYLVTGNAARVGVDSAALAGAGFTGPPSVLEGRMGMARAMADEVSWDAVTEGLGLTFRIRETYFKPYPSCRHSHAAIDAARQLAAPDGIDPALIARVEVRSYGLAVDECDHPEFSTLAGADSSFQFTVASTLRYGNFGLRWRSLEAVRDPVTRAIAGRIRVVRDPAFDARLPAERPARVTVELNDRRPLQAEVALARGEPENPMRPAELLQKAQDAAAPVLDRAGVEALRQLISRLEDQPVARLAEACAAEPRWGSR